MKYISLPIAISLVLTGCQTTTVSQIDEPKSSTNKVYTAAPSEIHQFLINKKRVVSQESTIAKEYGTVWDRIRDNLSFDVPNNRDIAKHRKYYMRDHRSLNRLLKRSEPFLFYIIEELEKNDIPIEIALLPLVESAFDPNAKSWVSAAGLWQFMPETGKQFGLHQNWWYDGRNDVVASTQSAIKYLKYLNGFFDGDWLLALAAYNSGEGRVQRTMRNNARLNQTTDYWSLELPKETQDYVPKLFAVIDIINRADELNVKLHPIANKSLVVTTPLTSQIDLSVAAKLAGISVKEFKKLNPGFKQWATDPNNSVEILLPKSKLEDFKAELSQLPELERMIWQRYQIKQGDSLGKIANRFNIDIKSIQRINKIKGYNIRAGKHLLIPSSSGGQQLTTLPSSLTSFSEPEQTESKVIYIVKPGDTLWDISRSLKVTSKDIAKWNDISTKSTLKLGQKLIVWQNKDPNNTASKNITYSVKRGDSFARIANKFDVKIKDLEMWNSLKRSNYLQPGQKLKIAIN